MFRKIIFSPLLLVSFFCFSQGKKSDTTVQLVKIEMEKFEPPPIGDFDLTLFNIFVLKSGAVYYYYDSSFTIKEEPDKYDLENLNESFLHKTTTQKLKEEIQSYLKKGNQTEIVLAVEGNDKKKVDKIFKEVLKPLKINEAQVGYITNELLNILQKIK